MQEQIAIINHNLIDRNLIDQSMTYPSFRKIVDDLFAENKTTGNNHSEAMLHYAKMNIVRMKRLDKTTKLSDQTIETIKNIDRPMIWLTITEGWCGDAAQILPVVERIAKENNNIDHHVILRDENLDVMDQFLTNGARSIPKIIFLDQETLEVLGDWGPRPAVVQKMVMDAKQKKLDRTVLNTDVQRWYAKDKTKQIQQEFIEAIEKI